MVGSLSRDFDNSVTTVRCLPEATKIYQIAYGTAGNVRMELVCNSALVHVALRVGVSISSIELIYYKYDGAMFSYHCQHLFFIHFFSVYPYVSLPTYCE